MDKETIQIETYKELIKEYEEQIEDLKISYQMCEHKAICNRILQLDENISQLKAKVYAISPSDCDW